MLSTPMATSASDGASIILGGGMKVNLPNLLTPELDGTVPGTLTASLDGQIVGTMSTDSNGAVSSVPLGWYTTAAYTTWDSGSVNNSNGKPFALYLLPAQPPETFAGAAYTEQGSAATQRYADLCIAAGLKPVSSGNGQSYLPRHESNRYTLPETGAPSRTGQSYLTSECTENHNAVPLGV